MRKFVPILLGIAVVALLGSSAYLYQRFHQTTDELAQSRANEESSRGRYAQTIDAISEIQDSLNAIAVGDANVQMMTDKLKSEKDLNSPNGRDALDRIATLRESIQRNKERIRQLESAVNKSGIQMKGLRKMIASLKTSVNDKEAQVAELSTRVNDLSTQVSGLQTTVQQDQEQIAQKDQNLEERRKELATVYYVVGDKKQLKDQGVIDAKGGVLGLGKTITPSGNVATSLLTPIDTDQQTVIPIEAPKARVITAQPATSYEMRLVDGKMELHILDPNEFRKVKQLVIVKA